MPLHELPSFEISSSSPAFPGMPTVTQSMSTADAGGASPSARRAADADSSSESARIPSIHLPNSRATRDARMMMSVPACDKPNHVRYSNHVSMIRASNRIDPQNFDSALASPDGFAWPTT